MCSAEELKELFGRGRAKKGMFEGQLEEGELEIGRSSLIKQLNRLLQLGRNME